MSRILFHELLHTKYSDTDSIVSYKIAYQREERNVFLENTIYVSQFSEGERVGHGSTTYASASSTAYLDDMELTSQGYDSIFKFEYGYDTITKDYNAYDKTVSGRSSYIYDHYISITLSSTQRLLFEDGSADNARLPNILTNSLATNGQNALTAAGSAISAVQTLRGTAQDENLAEGFSIATLQNLKFFSLTFMNMRIVSAEAYADSYNGGPYREYYGPTAQNATSTPSVLAVNAGGLDGVILFGGSGFSNFNIDASSMVDDLLGGGGNDLLLTGNSSGSLVNLADGGDGDDILIGGTGIDDLTGGNGDDLLVGGTGADILRGGAGSDVVSYSEAGAGISIDLTVRSSASDDTAVVGLAGADASGDIITDVETIIGSSHNDILKGDGTGVVLFGGDGLDELYGKAGDILLGGAGADVIHGNEAGIVLSGGAGNDKIFSSGAGAMIDTGAGDDEIQISSADAIIQFGEGDGTDIVEFDDGGSDYTLRLKNLTQAEISIIAGGVDLYGYNHQDLSNVAFEWLAIRINETGETITFVNSDKAVGPSGDANYSQTGVSYGHDAIPLSSIQFADSTVLTKSQIWSKIENWTANPEVSFDLMKTYPGWGGFRGEVRSAGAYLPHLNSTYFIASGIPEPAPQIVTGTSGGDLLSDGYGADTIVALAGDDTLFASFGNDTIEWNIGDGNDTVYSSGTDYGTDTIKLGAGINPGDLEFSVVGASLKISFAGQSGSIMLATELSSEEGRGAHQILFDDTTSWTHAQLLAFAATEISAAHEDVDGTSGDDYLYVPSTNFTVDGGTGNDTVSIYGDGYGDVLFSKGDGKDTYFSSGYRKDTLHLTDVLPGEVSISRSSNAIFITISGETDEIEVSAQFDDAGDGFTAGFNQIIFSDTTVWDREDIETAAGVSVPRLIEGTSGADYLSLPYYDSIVNAGLDDDVLSTDNSGSSTILYAEGDGNDFIGGGYGTRNDALSFADLLPEDVEIEQDGDAALITVISTGDVITIGDQFRNWLVGGVNSIVFSDDTTWDREDIETFANNSLLRGGGGQSSSVVSRDIEAGWNGEASAFTAAQQLVSAIGSFKGAGSFDSMAYRERPQFHHDFVAGGSHVHWPS